MDRTLSLTAALNELRRRGCYVSVEGAREQARRLGHFQVGTVSVAITFVGSRTFLDPQELDRAIAKCQAAEQAKRERLAEVTRDFRNGILHGNDGGTVEIEDGGYSLHGSFYFVWSDIARYNRKSDGTWYCRMCQRPAATEHNKPECHLCSDWNGCGRDCTLSLVYCTECGASLQM